MKKLGICICYQHRNYGSQLQSYATTVELRNRNIDYEIIRYKKKFTPALLIKSLPRLFNPVFINDRFKVRYQKKIMLQIHPELKNANDERNRCLAEFSKERFTRLSPVYYGYDELCNKAGNKYDGVMVGSDQLWNPGGITSNFYNLMFAGESLTKFSYSASFGVSRVEEKYHELYKTFLSRLDYISVRENSGKELVKQLSGREAEVVVDPVLLLNGDEWLKEIPNEKIYDEPYIFAYFLGKSTDYRRAVTDFARKKGLKIVTEHHMDSYNKADVDFGDYAPFNVGPAEFVNLIRNAEYVFTDSFHGSVFSTLYKKKFLVFNRYSDSDIASKNSRIDSFCANYALNDRRYDGNINRVDDEINYDEVLSRVEKHRKASKQFLDKALKDFS